MYVEQFLVKIRISLRLILMIGTVLTLKKSGLIFLTRIITYVEFLFDISCFSSSVYVEFIIILILQYTYEQHVYMYNICINI